MTDTQLYLAIGVPTLAVILGIILNRFQYKALSARIGKLEGRMLALESTMNKRIDMLIGKLAEIGTRVRVLEERKRS